MSSLKLGMPQVLTAIVIISAVASLAIVSMALSASINNADAQGGKITACLQVNTTAYEHSDGHSAPAISPVC